jgi:phage recombination protein Bet
MQNAHESSHEREDVSSVFVTRELIEKYFMVENDGLELSNAEKERLMATAIAYQLNPFKREIHVKISFEEGKRKMHLIVGYEVYIKKAERTGLLDGWKAWIEGSGDALKAVVEIQRKDWKNPFVHEVYWSEAVQKRSDGSIYDFWERMPKFQLKKVAISQGFRLCFSNEIGGIPYDSAELPIQESTSTCEKKPSESNPSAHLRISNDSKFIQTDKPSNGLPGSIHQLVMKNSTLFSDQHLAWIENQLRLEKTDAQLKGLQKHVEETIASGGDERGKPSSSLRTSGQKQESVKRRIPVTLQKQSTSRETSIF